MSKYKKYGYDKQLQNQLTGWSDWQSDPFCIIIQVLKNLETPYNFERSAN